MKKNETLFFRVLKPFVIHLFWAFHASRSTNSSYELHDWCQMNEMLPGVSKLQYKFTSFFPACSLNCLFYLKKTTRAGLQHVKNPGSID